MASAGMVTTGVILLLVGLYLLWRSFSAPFSTLIEMLLLVIGVVLIVAGFAQARKGRLKAI